MKVLIRFVSEDITFKEVNKIKMANSIGLKQSIQQSLHLSVN